MTLICAHLFSFLLSPIFPICYSLKEINTINLLFATVPFFKCKQVLILFLWWGLFPPTNTLPPFSLQLDLSSAKTY